MFPHQKAELQELLASDADGLLDEAGNDRLAAILRDSAEARRFYLRHTELCAALQWEYADAAAEPIPQPSRAGWKIRALPFAAAVAVALAAGLFLGKARGPEPLGRLELVEGAVTWHGRGAGLERGAAVLPGTLTLDGETSTVEIRLKDGTWVTFSGHTEATLLDPREPGINLRGGRMSASVAPPFRVVTPTAEVIGADAVFSIVVGEGRTTLEVDEGRVFFRRLVDGSGLEIPALHRATATLDASRAMTATRPETVPPAWAAMIGSRATRISCGSLDTSGPVPVVKAKPYIAGRKPEGDLITRNGVGLRPGRPESRGLVRLEPGSVLTLRYRCEWGPEVFISTHDDDGRFGGNFAIDLDRHHGTPDDHGWRRVEIPVEVLGPLKTTGDRHPEPYGKVVSLFLISVGHQTPLEVAGLTVQPVGLP